MVTQGIHQISMFHASKRVDYFVLPTAAQKNYTDPPNTARSLKEIMPEIDALLASDHVKRVIAVGDVSAINYYLALAKLPSMFSRKQKYEFVWDFFEEYITSLNF